MSRSISTNLLNAINKISGIKSNTRLTVYKNRNYFSNLDSTSGSPTYAQEPGITDTPISQTSRYDSTNARLYTLFVNPTSEEIEITTTGSDIVCTINTSGSPLISPKEGKIDGLFPYLYRIDKSGNLICSTLDMDILKNSFASGPLDCVSSEEVIETLTSGSPSGLSAIDEKEFIRLFIDDGGIGAIHYLYSGGSWVKNTYSHRFMVPNQVFPDLSTSAYYLNFFSAVKRTDGIWVYLSYPSGEVKGIHINTDGIWSDVFTAIPKDLSMFKIANAFIDINERIHLCGQFQRVDSLDAFSSDSIWNLLCSSDDGKIFTLDRNTLFSLLGYRFSAIPVDNDICYIDANRYKTLSGTYNSIYENADSLLLKKQIVDASGSPDSGYTLNLVTSNDALLDHELLIEGNVGKLEIGVNTTGSEVEYVIWDTCIIASITTNLANAKRNLSLELISEGFYRLQQFSYPFYLEIQGKQSFYDPINDMSNLYKAPNSSGIKEGFSVDFWGEEDEFSGGGLAPMFHNTEGSKVLMSGDLKDYLYLVDYPIIDSLPITFKIYGWSHIGILQGSDYINDTTPYTNPNDDFEAIIKVEHEDGDIESISISSSEAVNKSYPPQTWKPGSSRIDGSYPVEYILDVGHGLVLGDKIKEVGVFISSSSCTVFYAERIEIPEVNMYIDPDAFPQDSSEIADITGYDPMGGTSIWDFEDGTLQGWIEGSPPWGKLCITNATGLQHTDNFYYYNGGVGWSAGGGNWNEGSASIDVESLGFIINDGVTFTGTYYGVHSHAGFKINALVECTDGSKKWAFGDDHLGDTGWLIDGFVGTFTISFDETFYGKTIKRLWIGCFGYQFDNVSNKVFDNLSLNGVMVSVEDTFSDITTKKGIIIKNLGIPNVYFSSKPYSAFNFESSVKVKLVGSYSYGGLVGLAEDGRNFICGRYKTGTLQIVKVRNGETTILASTSYTSSATFVRIMFCHNNGDLSIRVMEAGVWGTAKLTYRWKYEDGPITTDPDLYHLGIFSISDVPKFRICSYDSSQSTFIGLLPGYSVSAFAAFPSSGTVVIDNIIYTYTGKTGTAIEPRGPYQLRCANAWDYASPADGEYYSGNSVEITYFDWKDNPTYHEEYKNYLILSNAGHGWMINEIDYKPWITTDGLLIYLNHRSRIFGVNLSLETFVSCSDKMFITMGLTGVALAPDQETFLHAEGSYCYQQEENEIEFTDYSASSDDPDSTITDLIDRICRMSGTKPLFPGDKTYPTLSLTDGTEESL
jgi:hypothetical protein